MHLQSMFSSLLAPCRKPHVISFCLFVLIIQNKLVFTCFLYIYFTFTCFHFYVLSGWIVVVHRCFCLCVIIIWMFVVHIICLLIEWIIVVYSMCSHLLVLIGWMFEPCIIRFCSRVLIGRTMVVYIVSLCHCALIG